MSFRDSLYIKNKVAVNILTQTNVDLPFFSSKECSQPCMLYVRMCVLSGTHFKTTHRLIISQSIRDTLKASHDIMSVWNSFMWVMCLPKESTTQAFPFIHSGILVSIKTGLSLRVKAKEEERKTSLVSKEFYSTFQQSVFQQFVISSHNLQAYYTKALICWGVTQTYNMLTMSKAFCTWL